MKQLKRTLSIVISAAMILQVGITPIMAQSQSRRAVEKTITAFAVIPEDKANIILPLGIPETELQAALVAPTNLPRQSKPRLLLAKLTQQLISTIPTTAH